MVQHSHAAWDKMGYQFVATSTQPLPPRCKLVTVSAQTWQMLRKHGTVAADPW